MGKNEEELKNEEEWKKLRKNGKNLGGMEKNEEEKKKMRRNGKK